MLSLPFQFARFRLWRILWCVLLVAGTAAQAADVSVRASVNRSVTVIGDPVQYQIKVTGAQRVGDPPEVNADGLIVRYLGPTQSSVTRFQNGSFTAERTLTWIYQVAAERNGSFTIPAIAVEADGRAYRTEPVGLTVQSSTATAPGDGQAIGFAEFVVPKKTAYIGEMIPVELRLYVDARVRWQPVKMPDIVGEGFTMQKMPEPQRKQTDKNGREYDVLIFKTAVTPSRAGKITIGPSELPFNARVPRARKSGPRSLFDMFDDDVFGDAFFSTTQQLKAKAEAVTINVKPLPVEGKPDGFSGAIGHFEFTAEGNPKQVKIGDPVTMKLTVKGRGNFDRMSAPVLKDAQGWRSYPPSNSFKAEDDVNFTGTKTFEIAVVPESKKSAMPDFEFSYFDPLSEKYMTLNSEAGPLVVDDRAPVAAPPPVVEAKPGQATPPPAARVDDIVGLRYDRDGAQSFAFLSARREFWLAQGALALTLLGLLTVRLYRRPDAAVVEAAGLRRERTSALARLRDGKLGHVDFFELAARVAQIETALATGRPVAGIDAATVNASAKLDASSAETIDEIFNSRAELLYAGSGRSDEAIAPVARERVLAALDQLGKAHAKH